MNHREDYLEKAAQGLREVEHMQDPKERETMLKLVEGYIRLADHADYSSATPKAPDDAEK
jgi:hypothetical protein